MKNPVKTGLPYEMLVQQIFNDIVRTEQDRTVDVRHDVILEGITSTHQIDVYWEFDYAGIKHKVIVQAKDWNKPVDQGELLKFKAVLDDLPGQPRGVLVTRKGYQRGAAEFARAHGIQLFELIELKPPSAGGLTITTLGWAHFQILGDPKSVDGEAPKFVLRGTPFEPKIDNVVIEADSVWLRELDPGIARALTERKDYSSAAGYSFCDGSRNVVQTLHDLFKEAVDDMRKTGANLRKLTHRFSEPTFLATGLPVAPYLKVNGLTANIQIEAGEPVDQPFELPNIVTFILRNLSDGTTRVIQRKK